MKKPFGKGHLDLFHRIAENAQNNLVELSKYWNVYEKQRYFINAIGIYDKLYVDVTQAINDGTEIPFKYRLFDYGYPVFIDLFYDEAFASLPGVVLKPVDENLLTLLNKLLYACGIIGWMHWLIDNVNSGYMKSFAFGKHVWLRFNYKFHWNEYLENEYISWYSECVLSSQQDNYDKLNIRRQQITNKLEKTVYIFNDCFMGYTNDEDVEEFFNTLALLDAQRSIEWDMFSKNAIFGNTHYGNIVQTIVDFSGYSMKHANYAQILKSNHKELIMENLMPNIIQENDIVKLISLNISADECEAKCILNTLSLTPEKKNYYENTSASCAPFIKISSVQYLRSIRGFLEHPFNFMLYSLKRLYSGQWDKNVNDREYIFRTQIYSLFRDERFVCIDHPVIIKDKSGKTITDIDAMILDKITNEIAFFQLKWQDPVNDTMYSLKSKSENYKIATQKWAEKLIAWLKVTSNEEIARALSVKKRQFDKEKIYIFVIGRIHGNYSSDKSLSSNDQTVYGQWFQLLKMATYLTQQNTLSISNLFRLLLETTPFNRKILEEKTVFKYDKYSIHLGGGIIS